MGLPLGVYWGEDEQDEPHIARELAREPRLGWRLREFFANWSLPLFFQPRHRAQGTLDNYEDSLRYWEQVTDDPRLVDVFFDRDDQISIDFVGTLPEWGYSRRGVRRGEPIRIGRISECPAFTPLSSLTASGHAARIATLLQQAGPRYAPRQRVAELLPRCPYVPPVEADFDPKPPYELEQARQIARACTRMEGPDLPPWIDCELWWKTRLSLFYYTGLRAGTVVELRWSHLEQRNGCWWLKVPKSIVKKTKKAIELAVHPQLAEFLEQVRSQGTDQRTSEDLILPPGCCYRHFQTLHVDLQAAAEVPEDERQSPHAWRRTHLTQIGELGANRAIEFAQIAADHTEGRTTANHYLTTLVNQFRLRLPELFV